MSETRRRASPIDTETLRARVEAMAEGQATRSDASLATVHDLLEALESGAVRAARPVRDGWVVEAWVKRGILSGFRIGRNVATSVLAGPSEDLGSVVGFHFRDRDTYPTRSAGRLDDADVRVVPGGTTVRRGAFVGQGVVIMPPAYVNVGAWIGPGSMIDSHALVGSCAQIGAGVHLSAAAQIGGVLEPVGARPVIVEDEAFIGGGCGVYEGTRVGRGAVLAPGVVLSRGVPLYDLVEERILRATDDTPLEVPERAVVVAGARPAKGAFAERERVQLQSAVIVKYRDASTDAAAALESALR